MDSKKIPDLEIELYQQYQESYSRKNYLFLTKIGVCIYPFWAIIDFVIGDRDFLFYLMIRMLTILPILGCIWAVQKRKFKNIDLCVYILFIFIALGISVSSYFAGKLLSDYAYGLLIISFAQFIILPRKLFYVAAVDITFILIYFPLNYSFSPGDYIPLVKQLAIYGNFTLFKFLCAKKLHQLIYGSFFKITKKKELEQNEAVAHLFGELCHLISNPLFISQSSLKLAQRTRLIGEKDKYIDKSLATLGRINNVLKKMQDFHRDENLKIKFP